MIKPKTDPSVPAFKVKLSHLELSVLQVDLKRLGIDDIVTLYWLLMLNYLVRNSISIVVSFRSLLIELLQIVTVNIIIPGNASNNEDKSFIDSH